MKTPTTTPARRISREHNKRLQMGFHGNGFLLFRADGTGGAWYTDNDRPPSLPTDIKITMRWHHMTSRQAQEILDANL